MANPWELDWSRTKVDAAPAGGAGKVSQQDNKMLNDARATAEAARTNGHIYDDTDQAIKDFQPSPGKAKLFSAMTYDPQSTGVSGFFTDTLPAFALGNTVGRLLYSQKDFDNYQKLKALQNERIAARQVEQKGPQTEADAMRYGLSDVGPDKDLSVNESIIKRGRGLQAVADARPRAMTAWIAKYGSLQNANPQGVTYDDWWKNYSSKVFGATSGQASQPRAAPKASQTQGGRPVYDINGNRIR